MCLENQYPSRHERSVREAEIEWLIRKQKEYASRNSRSHHENLAALIKAETSVDIDPNLLRLFIKSKWSRIAALAHSIHEETT